MLDEKLFGTISACDTTQNSKQVASYVENIRSIIINTKFRILFISRYRGEEKGK